MQTSDKEVIRIKETELNGGECQNRKRKEGRRKEGKRKEGRRKKKEGKERPSSEE